MLFREITHPTAVRFLSEIWPHLIAVIITLSGVIVGYHLLYLIAGVPNPALFFVVALAVCVYYTTPKAGMTGAAIIIFSSFVVFSEPGRLFHYSDAQWRLVMAVVVCAPVISMIIGLIKEQVDALRKASAENETLKTETRRMARVHDDLRLRDARSRRMLDSIEDRAVLMIDSAGKVTAWNAGAERMLGYRPEEIVGQHHVRFYTREDIERGKPQYLLQLAALKGRLEEEGWRVRKGGARFPAHAVITALKNEAGETLAYIETLREAAVPAKLREVTHGTPVEPEISEDARATRTD